MIPPFKLVEVPAHILNVTLLKESFRISMPETTHKVEKPPRESALFSTPYIKLRSGAYMLFPGAIGSTMPFNPSHENRKISSSDWFPPLAINENLTIKSFHHWHELTEKNPDFMKEELDPEFFCENMSRTSHRSYHLKEAKQTCFLVPTYLSTGSSSPAKISIFPPRRRSIMTNNCIRELSMPKMALVIETADPFQFLCLMHIKDQSYIPFEMPDVNQLGGTCLGPESVRYEDKLDYFWNSWNSNARTRVAINKNLKIESTYHWEQLTRENPDFFRDLFDPDYALEQSDIIYTIGENSISWRFNP